MVPPNPFKNIMMESAVTALSMTKTKTRERLKAKAKAVILVPTPTNSVLKYLILLLQHPSKLKYF